MYHILIVGAGYVGGAIARHFRSQRQKVSSLIHDPSDRKALEKDGILTFAADLNQPETLKDLPPAHFIVMCATPDQHDENHYRKLYVEGTKHFLSAIRHHRLLHLVVFLSSTKVWGDRKGDWVDESVAADPDTEKGKILLEAEEQILNSSLPSVVFRLGGIYGPERNRIQSLRDGTWPKPGRDSYLNLIHQEDVVGAIPVLFSNAKEGSVYVGVDNEPIKRSEYCCWLCEKTKIAVPQIIPSGQEVGGKRCRNDRLKDLGFKFKYPTFREGYENLLS